MSFSILTSNVLQGIGIQTYNADSICFYLSCIPLDLMPGTKRMITIDKTGFVVTIYNCFENVSIDM